MYVNRLPYHVEICGRGFDINTDFRTSIKFAELIADNKIDPTEKLLKILHLYYNTLELPDIKEAVEKIIWFYSLGKLDNLEELTQEENNDLNTTISQEVFDYDYDFGFIYASFLQQYRIDIFEEEELHWWKFKFLLQSLSEDTKLVKIINYRTKKIDKNMTKEERRFYTEMKKLYQLPSKKEENDIENFHSAISSLI